MASSRLRKTPTLFSTESAASGVKVNLRIQNNVGIFLPTELLLPGSDITNKIITQLINSVNNNLLSRSSLWKFKWQMQVSKQLYFNKYALQVAGK